jgi:hypothetical protein
MDLELASKVSIFLGSVFIILVGAISSSGFSVYGAGGWRGEQYVFMTKWGSLGTANGQFKDA